MPSQTRRVSLASMAILLLICSSGFYWYARADNAHLRNQLRTFRATAPFPPVVNGMRLELGGVKTIASDANSRPMRISEGKRSMVLVAADDCGICRQVLPRWRRLMKEPFEGEIVLVTAQGSAIVDELSRIVQARNGALRTLQIDSIEAFGLGTGVVSTPATILLDEEARVRLFAANMDDAGESDIREALRRHSGH